MQQARRPSTIALAGVIFVLSAAWAAAVDQCDMAVTTLHGDPERTPILASTTGEKAIFFAADLDVNTDGAARSYHPDDPRGQSLALNNMGNAITQIFDAQGHDITCSPRSGACFTLFMNVFEELRDAGYARDGHRRFETTGIIPWQHDPSSGRSLPCTIRSGPFAGYFISQTALLVNTNADVCEQGRYLDALSMNAIVLPRSAVWKSQGVRTDSGDLAVLLDAKSGRLAFALVGDTGPARAIGEGTVALAAALGGAEVSPTATFADVKALKRTRVGTVIFPTRDVPRTTGGRFTQADIDRLGVEALSAFGGLERLQACVANPNG